MAGNRPEERVLVPFVRQSWRHVTLLHWPVAEDAVARLLPPGLEPDLVDGRAWVSLTPFEVRGFRPSVAPPLPGISSFPETNLRTYVRRPSGEDGLWFLSLDVASLVSTLGGRALCVPYHLARMSVEAGDGVVRYTSARVAGSAHHLIEVEVGERAAPAAVGEPDGRDGLLAGRWRAFVQSPVGLLAVPVRHEPWPLFDATLRRLDETIAAAAGVTVAGEPAVVQYSPGVDAHLGVPRRA